MEDGRKFHNVQGSFFEGVAKSSFRHRQEQRLLLDLARIGLIYSVLPDFRLPLKLIWPSNELS